MTEGMNREGMLHPIRLRAMNTHIEAILAGSATEDARSLETLLHSWFHRQEERFSRFLPDSELSHLNDLAGELCLVSDAMLEVIALAEAYRKETGGLFHPLVVKALRSAGYDATFDEIKDRERFPIDPGLSLPAADSLPPIAIDTAMRSIRLPKQAEMDLGGIVKGWTVRRLSTYLQHSLGLRRGLVNAGGDLTVWGAASVQGDPWIIGIESPWRPEADAGMIAMCDGAAATSSTLGRSWPTSSGSAHHIIDPRTMRPGDSDVVQCTVTGADAAKCEAWAKALCIAGSEQGPALFARQAPDYEALLFTRDGSTVFCGSEKSMGSRWLGLNPDSIKRPPAA